MDAALNNQPVPPDAVRMVGIRKVSGEHLVSRPAEWDSGGLHPLLGSQFDLWSVLGMERCDSFSVIGEILSTNGPD